MSCPRGRRVLLSSSLLGLVFLDLVLLGAQAPAAQAAPAQVSGGVLTALAAPVVAPGVQTETVSWQAPENPSGTPTYTVTSSPEGRSCVTTTTSCLMSGINDATPWRYSVTYEIESDISELSLWSLRVPTKKIVVVAGQSNAAGIGAVAAVPGWFDYLQMTADPPLIGRSSWPGTNPWMRRRLLRVSMVPSGY